MVVIIYRKRNVFGKEQIIPTYLPFGTIPTQETRDIASSIDDSIRSAVFTVNKEYIADKKSIKTQIDKWRWLGDKLEKLLRSLPLLEKIDIENNSIWPAIAQYLHSDLVRGFDAKRSGTHKDHLRKVWLLATLPDTDWFNTWTGWDAFIDRGESLVADSRILKFLKKIFPHNSYNLGKDDYQSIARLLVETLSSKKGNAVNFGMLTDSEIEKAIEQVAQKITPKN